MKIKKVKIKCFTYKIHFIKAASDHGETDTDTKDIYINMNYPIEVQRETLNHEILHACFTDFPNFGKEGKPDDCEEDLIRYISPTLVQVYKDNKWLREFVFGVKE